MQSNAHQCVRIIIRCGFSVVKWVACIPVTTFCIKLLTGSIFIQRQQLWRRFILPSFEIHYMDFRLCATSCRIRKLQIYGLSKRTGINEIRESGLRKTVKIFRVLRVNYFWYPLNRKRLYCRKPIFQPITFRSF